MNIRFGGYVFALVAMTTAAPARPSYADQTFNPSPGGGVSTAPFGGGNAFSPTPTVTTTEHEDIYGASAFSSLGTVSFTSLNYTLFTEEQSGLPADASYDVTIGLSTTDVSANNPFPNFAENRGADYTTVFTGVTHVTPSISTDLTFPISPFTYNPADGNLLIDLDVTSTIDNVSLVNVINEPDVTFFDQSDVFIQGGTTSTVITGDTTTAVQFGYVSPSATPEPSSLVPIGLGAFCILGLCVRTRGRAAKSGHM